MKPLPPPSPEGRELSGIAERSFVSVINALSMISVSYSLEGVGETAPYSHGSLQSVPFLRLLAHSISSFRTPSVSTCDEVASMDCGKMLTSFTAGVI